MQSTPADVADHPWHPVHHRLAEVVRPRAGEVIVDLGCGSGASLAALAARWGSGVSGRAGPACVSPARGG